MPILLEVMYNMYTYDEDDLLHRVITEVRVTKAIISATNWYDHWQQKFEGGISSLDDTRTGGIAYAFEREQPIQRLASKINHIKISKGRPLLKFDPSIRM